MPARQRKRWVVVTGLYMELADFRGQFPVAGVPGADGYAPGEWIEILVTEQPRSIWRLLCLEIDLPTRPPG